MEVKLFYMIGGKPVTGGQIYEYLFVNVLKSIPSIRVKIQTNEKWARGIRKVVAPIVNVRILNKVRNDDVVIFNSSKFIYWILVLPLIRLLGNKRVYVIHHHFMYLDCKWYEYPLNVMEKLLLRCADRLIIPSPYVKELVECLRLNNSVFYLPIPFEKKLWQKLNPQEGRLLFVGTVEKRKGLKYLIEAMTFVKNANVKCVLDVVGKVVDEIYFENMKQIVEEYKLDVTFHGFVSLEQKERLYASADIFVFPSLLEGYGMVLMEAMGYGLPIVAFNNSAMPYSVENGINGYLADNLNSKHFAEYIIRILSDRTLRAKLSKGASEIFEKAPDINSFKKLIVQEFASL